MTAAAELRPMTEADLPAARALWAAADGVELAEGDSVAELTQYLRRNPGLSFVATVGGAVIGAVLAGHDGRRGYLYHLAVSREHQGRGLGRDLVARSVALLREAHITRALILVARDNESGRRFWSRQRWEPLDLAEPMGLDL